MCDKYVPQDFCWLSHAFHTDAEALPKLQQSFTTLTQCNGTALLSYQARHKSEEPFFDAMAIHFEEHKVWRLQTTLCPGNRHKNA